MTTYQEIIKNLKNKIYKPIYFLYGEEPYFIDRITNFITQNVLTEAEKSFNQTTLYGRDTDIETVINTSRRYPMMSNHQVVIIKEAQHLQKIENLEVYINNPLKSTILVLNYKYKKPDKRKKITKLLEKKTVFFESQKIRDDKLPLWINKYLKIKNYQIHPNAAIMIAEYLGNDLLKVSHELEKLTILVSPDQQITPEIVEKNIGISKEYNVFELQKALGQCNIKKANEIIYYFSKNPKEYSLIKIIGLLFSYFQKIYTYHSLNDKSDRNVQIKLKIFSSYFIKDYIAAANRFSAPKLEHIISLLREYDAKTKGVGNVSATEGELMRELVYKILH